MPLDWPAVPNSTAETFKAQSIADKAHAAYVAKNYELAAALFGELLKIKPGDARVYFNRGNSYKLQQLDRALNDFSEALRLAPDLVVALLNRGNIYLRTEHFSEALADYDKAIALEPDNFLVCYNRGLVLGRLRRFEDAVESLSDALLAHDLRSILREAPRSSLVPPPPSALKAAIPITAYFYLSVEHDAPFLPH